ncbi:MAG: hypothetical protein AB8I08_28675 [Sandaracinaceae bacterium]
MRRLLLSVLLVCVTPALAGAQDDLVVPPPPGAEPAPVPDVPAPATPAAVPSPDAPPPIPPAPTGVGGSLASPTGEAAPAPLPPSTAEPLLQAAEQDLAQGNIGLATARLEIAMSVLVPNTPLHVRAQALAALAQARQSEVTVVRPPEQVVSPLLVQAERDLAIGQPALAHARATLALTHLPEASPLRARAAQITGRAATAAPTTPLTTQAATPYSARPYASAAQPFEPYRREPHVPPPDPSHRGTGEIVELYITAGLFGVGSGIYLTSAGGGGPDGAAYALTAVGGGAVMAASVLLLDLTDSIETGMAPAISTGIRAGLAFGLTTAYMLSEVGVSPDPLAVSSLIWGGSALGLVAGAAIGFGANPSVRQVRFIESTELWGLGLGVGLAMLTDFQDAAGSVLMFGGLSVGLLSGLSVVAANAELSTRHSLFLDLGFMAGGGVGAAIVGAIAVYGDLGGDETIAVGGGLLAGSIAGWALLYGLTSGMDDSEEEADPESPEVRMGMSPVEGGGVGSLYGTF